LKQGLLRIRRETLIASDGEVEIERQEMGSLDKGQVEYLLNLVNSPDVEESDAELVLVLLRDHGDQVLPRMLSFLERYPGLTKSAYNYARFATDRTGLDDMICQFLNTSPNVTEYQLFWVTKLAEDFLSSSAKYGTILTACYDHPNATTVTRAKVLEIPERRFGLPELREETLRSGRSDWEGWAAAAGTRLDPAAGRNHLLTYFSNGSPINRLLAECVRALRETA
jgi:hypothetical protein